MKHTVKLRTDNIWQRKELHIKEINLEFQQEMLNILEKKRKHLILLQTHDIVIST